MSVRIAVVIPTYNRTLLLQRCLKALCNQTLNRKSFEVIVVSDGEDHQTKKMIEHLADEENMQLHYEELKLKSGPAAARNAGWKKAKSPLIAFTDDDCIPDENWLLNLLSFHKNELLVAYTGKLIVPRNDPPTDYEKNLAGLETAEFITANCCCTKKALEAVGGFDENFTIAWREDSDLHFKLIRKNIPVYKITNAVVVHPVRPVPWAISLAEQKKAMFNALLYKKDKSLFRERIKKAPNGLYYFICICFIGLLISLFFSATIALLFFLAWLAATGYFIHKRLKSTSKQWNHIAEMIVTSLFIPLLSVFWTLYGSYKFKVLYL